MSMLEALGGLSGAGLPDEAIRPLFMQAIQSSFMKDPEEEMKKRQYEDSQLGTYYAIAQNDPVAAQQYAQQRGLTSILGGGNTKTFNPADLTGLNKSTSDLNKAFVGNIQQQAVSAGADEREQYVNLLKTLGMLQQQDPNQNLNNAYSDWYNSALKTSTQNSPISKIESAIPWSGAMRSAVPFDPFGLRDSDLTAQIRNQNIDPSRLSQYYSLPQ